MAKNTVSQTPFSRRNRRPGSGLKPPAGRTARSARSADQPKHYATKKVGVYRCAAPYVPQGLHGYDGHG